MQMHMPLHMSLYSGADRVGEGGEEVEGREDDDYRRRGGD